MNKIFILTLLISLPQLAKANCDREQGEENIRRCRAMAEAESSRQQGNQQGNQQGQPRASSNVTRCESLFDQAVGAPVASTPPTGVVWQGVNQPFPAPPVTVPATYPPLLTPEQVRPAEVCRSLQKVTILANGGSFGVTDRATSQDGKISCQKLAGYTADWESCRGTLSMYNNVVLMESALFLVQAVQSNQAQNSIQQQATVQTNNGDGQGAAYDAQIANARKASELNQQKAAAYAAAVVALGSKIASWIKDDEAGLKNALCNNGRQNSHQLGSETIFAPAPTAISYVRPAAVPAPASCPDAVSKAYNAASGEMVANRQAKAAFTTAAMVFAAKGIQAGIAASQLGNVAKRVEEAKKQTEVPFDAPTFERCQVDPTNPACAGPVTRSSGSGLQEGGFGFGDSFGNNAFTPLGDEEKLGDIAPLPLPGDETVAGVSNPFVDDAKAASGILDPAGAASVQPGAAGGGGGGGGASAPGGGSASLGNDTPGPDDSKKENDIKANKADGKYNIAGGGAFQAIKPMKDENPFANLFDGKGGKLEEDRSIASGDIDGQDSGLFSKISKRYGQIKADGRIEAKNVDE